jgi:hypothetical protein
METDPYKQPAGMFTCRRAVLFIILTIPKRGMISSCGIVLAELESVRIRKDAGHRNPVSLLREKERGHEPENSELTFYAGTGDHPQVE